MKERTGTWCLIALAAHLDELRDHGRSVILADFAKRLVLVIVIVSSRCLGERRFASHSWAIENYIKCLLQSRCHQNG